ncbi:MAG: hypothetical protein GY729_10865 [Desulfobacteraceae bacterium]|nr:hypothetical protein [Desulfobacteraceae bacterium]
MRRDVRYHEFSGSPYGTGHRQYGYDFLCYKRNEQPNPDIFTNRSIKPTAVRIAVGFIQSA